MAIFVPSRRHPRVVTRLRGFLSSQGANFPATIVSLSEGGFCCEGPGLDRVASPMRVGIRLQSQEPSWRPRDPDCPWAGDDEAELAFLEAQAELLYVDLHRNDESGSATVGLGARFVDLDEGLLESVREYVSREMFRTRQWRAWGGPPLHAESATEPAHPLFR